MTARNPILVNGNRTLFDQQVVGDPTPPGEPTVFETGIPMRDGVELAATVWLPSAAALPVPAIVSVTPYDKDNSVFSAEEAKFYRGNEYAYVSVDTRGRGKSEGVWEAFVHDAEDTHDVIEWAGTQDWSTGAVGTTGLSYMGWVQWAAASQRPAHLRCMVSTSAAGRWQQEIPYLNGVFQLYFGWWVYLVRRRIAEAHGLEQHDWDAVLRTLPVRALGEVINPTGPTWDMLMTHDTMDDLWRSLRFEDLYSTIDVPCLHVTGWYDLEDLLGAFHHYEHMMADSPAADRQRLLVGPWSHVKSRFPDRRYADIDFGTDAAVDMDAEHLRWFDYWLKGIDNGVAEDPPVSLFEPGPNRWRTPAAWPTSTGTRTLHFGGDAVAGTLRVDGADSACGARSFTYDPADPMPTGLDVRNYPVEDVPLDQTANEGRADVLTYTGEVLDDALTVSGWPRVHLSASSDREDTDWHVKITDVHPDGRSVKVTQGCLRACHRESLDTTSAPMVAGTVYEFDVEMWPTHHVFLPGHRIRVSVTSSDFPWFARNLNQMGPVVEHAEPLIAVNTVHHGPGTLSRVELPVEEGRTVEG
ncbi:CocE/NonD family hydrolase [Mycolicibacterium brisbanense]